MFIRPRLVYGRPTYGPPLAPTTMQSSVTQYGITWTFDQPYPVGQFVNGDYFVVANSDVTIVDIDPLSEIDGGGRTRHGSMLNPEHGEVQAYDSEPVAGGFEPANNVGRPGGMDISASNPLLLGSGSSLVSTRTEIEPNIRPHVVDAQILTVVAEPPPVGSFRPPYSGSDKTPRWNVDDLQWSALPRIASIPSRPDWQTMEQWIERPWIDHVGGLWIGRKIHPSNNMPDYGRDMAYQTSAISLALLLDYPQSVISTLMIRYVQLGIDWYGVTRYRSTTGVVWWGGGGHGQGRQWPILFAGIMLNDLTMLSYANAGGYRSRWDEYPWPSDPGGNGNPVFQEQQQFFVVGQGDVDQPRYTADGRPRDPYTVEMIGTPEWGEQHANDPQRDGSNWDAYYRDLAVNSIAGHVLAARIMGAESLWGWDTIFSSLDRWVDSSSVHGRWSGGANPAPQFVREMWTQYRT